MLSVYSWLSSGVGGGGGGGGSGGKQTKKRRCSHPGVGQQPEFTPPVGAPAAVQPKKRKLEKGWRPASAACMCGAEVPGSKKRIKHQRFCAAKKWFDEKKRLRKLNGRK